MARTARKKNSHMSNFRKKPVVRRPSIALSRPSVHIVPHAFHRQVSQRSDVSAIETSVSLTSGGSCSLTRLVPSLVCHRRACRVLAAFSALKAAVLSMGKVIDGHTNINAEGACNNLVSFQAGLSPICVHSRPQAADLCKKVPLQRFQLLVLQVHSENLICSHKTFVLRLDNNQTT